MLEAIRRRLADCGVELHATKTKIVYCKDDDRRGTYERVKFDFLGYTFQPRRAMNRWGRCFVSFLPAISNQAAKAVRRTIRQWRMSSTRNNQTLEDLARLINPAVRGWMNRAYPVVTDTHQIWGRERLHTSRKHTTYGGCLC